jgi:hypothetical protein
VNEEIQPAGGRRVMSTGFAIMLIVVGAVLRFAVATTSTHGLNVHVVGVILILAGVLGLLLSLLVWGRLNRRRNRPVGYDGRATFIRRRVYQDQPSATFVRRVSQDQPLATGDERVYYQDQPPE